LDLLAEDLTNPLLTTEKPNSRAGDDLTALLAHRQQFSALANKQYFNYGGQGPMGDRALTALFEAQRQIQIAGPFAQAVEKWLQAEDKQIRAVLAQALGTPTTSITLTENVTQGCNIPLWGLPWQPGDHILMGDCEHYGIVAAVNELSRRYGVTVSRFSVASRQAVPTEVVATIQQALQPTTRLVILSHILWNTGQLLPLADIVAACHAHSPQTRVLVDAAQSAGVLPLDQDGEGLLQMGVDYYALTGHKWWCGAGGLGALYVSPTALAETSPTFIGWRSVEIDSASNPVGWKPDGRRFEVATADFALWGALRSAIAIQAEWGSSLQRYQRICSLSERLWQGLRAIDGVTCLLTEAPPAGLVSFQITDANGTPSPAKHNALVQQLAAKGIHVRTLLSPHCVRACVHYLTLESEVDGLIETIQGEIQGEI
jgi:L-cysteine/cystine lyase